MPYPQAPPGAQLHNQVEEFSVVQGLLEAWQAATLPNERSLESPESGLILTA
jgi:hypothetical protein